MVDDVEIVHLDGGQGDLIRDLVHKAEDRTLIINVDGGNLCALVPISKFELLAASAGLASDPSRLFEMLASRVEYSDLDIDINTLEEMITK